MVLTEKICPNDTSHWYIKRYNYRMSKKTEAVYTHRYNSPVGELHLAVDRRGSVMSVSFAPLAFGEAFVPDENKYACGELELQLDEYFAGSRDRFTLSLRFSGTPFQESVWNRLLKIPYGQTVTYGKIAQKIGRREAARAVGNAVARNPICLLVPCHRVVPASGGIGAYGVRSGDAETGAKRKRWLLALEEHRQHTEKPVPGEQVAVAATA